MLSAGLPLAGAQIEVKTEVQKGEKLGSGWIVRPADDENVGVEIGALLNVIRPNLKSSMSYLWKGSFLFLVFSGFLYKRPLM